MESERNIDITLYELEPVGPAVRGYLQSKKITSPPQQFWMCFFKPTIFVEFYKSKQQKKILFIGNNDQCLDFASVQNAIKLHKHGEEVIIRNIDIRGNKLSRLITDLGEIKEEDYYLSKVWEGKIIVTEKSTNYTVDGLPRITINDFFELEDNMYLDYIERYTNHTEDVYVIEYNVQLFLDRIIPLIDDEKFKSQA